MVSRREESRSPPRELPGSRATHQGSKHCNGARFGVEITLTDFVCVVSEAALRPPGGDVM